MLGFRKNKDDKTAKIHRYRYDLSSLADKEISDVLLTKKNEAPLAAKSSEFDTTSKAAEIIYELVVEDKNTTANDPPMSADWNEQIEKLCREYEVINKQLEKSLLTTQELTQQLEKSKKLSIKSYAALGVAGLALLVGIVAIMFGISMQRDVADLTTSVSTLASQTVIAKKESALKAKEMTNRIEQLNNNVNKIFAVGNMDTVLQVTRELRKQVHALANKNLAIINGHNHSRYESVNDKIALPSLKLDSDLMSQNNKNLSTSQLEKSALITKVDSAKNTQNAKLEPVANLASVEAETPWNISFGTFKNPALAKEAANKLTNAGELVDVIQIKGKKHPRYRIVSKPFKNKQMAKNHAEQVQKTLEFHSVMLIKTK